MAKTNYHQARRQKEDVAQGAPAGKAGQETGTRRAGARPRSGRGTGDAVTTPATAATRRGREGTAVKFTSTNGRNQLRERQRRDRATAQVLRNAYPQFASLRLEFDFSEPETSAPAPQVLVLHPPSQAYFVFSCPVCRLRR